VRDDQAVSLQTPSDGSVKSLRALLERLDDASIEVDSLSVHTPDLDSAAPWGPGSAARPAAGPSTWSSSSPGSC